MSVRKHGLTIYMHVFVVFPPTITGLINPRRWEKQEYSVPSSKWWNTASGNVKYHEQMQYLFPSVSISQDQKESQAHMGKQTNGKTNGHNVEVLFFDNSQNPLFVAFFLPNCAEHTMPQ